MHPLAVDYWLGALASVPSPLIAPIAPTAPIPPIAPIVPIAPICSDTSDLYPLIPIYISLQGNSSDPILSRISTWGISNLHVDIFLFPRGRDSFPPKFHLIPPRNFFFPTWKIKILHVDISKYPRGNHFSPTSRRIDM